MNPVRYEAGMFFLEPFQPLFIKNLELGSDSTVTRILIHKIEEILTGKEYTDISGELFVDLNDILACDELYTLTVETLERMDVKTTKKELIFKT